MYKANILANQIDVFKVKFKGFLIEVFNYSSWLLVFTIPVQGYLLVIFILSIYNEKL